MTQDINDNLVLISGASATGKSASFRSLKNPEGVVYLGCEAGKKLPFKNNFATYTITDPYQVWELFDVLAVKGNKIKHPQLNVEVEVHTVIIDSLTFLMDMFESMHVLGSADTMRGWSNYQQFFKTLMQDKVAKCTCNVLMTAHTLTILNENEMAMEVKVPIKGALKNNGVESYFSCVVSTKKVPIKKLEPYKNDYLNVTEDDEIVGYKHVYQTRLTKDTVNERIRNPMGMYALSETFIDNDAQYLIDRLGDFYNTKDQQ